MKQKLFRIYSPTPLKRPCCALPFKLYLVYMQYLKFVYIVCYLLLLILVYNDGLHFGKQLPTSTKLDF